MQYNTQQFNVNHHPKVLPPKSNLLNVSFLVASLMSTLTVGLYLYCRWEDETARNRTGHHSSYAETKKMKSLALHPYGCVRARLRINFTFPTSSTDVAVHLVRTFNDSYSHYW